MCPARTWAIIFGGIMGGSLFIPNFRHMRLFTIFALFATVFTAFYMIIQSGDDASMQVTKSELSCAGSCWKACSKH